MIIGKPDPDVVAEILSAIIEWRERNELMDLAEPAGIGAAGAGMDRPEG